MSEQGAAPVPPRPAKDIGALFTPRSIAIVGCSATSTGKLGSWPLRNLLLQQTKVPIYPVNPGHDTIDGLRSYPTLDALPESPDVVLVMLPAAQSLAALRDAERLGARAGILFGAGFGESAGGADLEAELRAFAERSPLAICGPNTDGVINIVDGIPCGFPPFAAIVPRPVGDVAVVSQSGALVSSLVVRLMRAGVGLTYSCAVGNGTDLRAADYLAWLATDERTRTVLVYAEGIPDMSAFLDAADEARRNGKAVVVLKGGRTDAGAAATRSHTGSLVGSYDVFRSVCAHHGIVCADNFEELATLPALVGAARRMRDRGRRGGFGVGLMSGSGAIGAFMADKAVEAGLRVAELAPGTLARLEGRFQFTEAANPIDLTGQVVHDPALHTDCLDALCADPGIDVVVTSSLYGPADITDRMKREIVAAADAGANVVVYANDGNQASEEPILREGGVAVVPSADVLFTCLHKLAVADATPVRTRRTGSGDAAAPSEALAELHRLPDHAPVPAALAWRLLHGAGIPVVAEHVVERVDDAPVVARRIGLPVVAKVNAPTVAHRSELGLVRLGLSDEQNVGTACRELAERIEALAIPDAAIVLQPMVPAGVEMLAAIRHDAECGPIVVIGAGGVFTEVLADRQIAPAPLDVLTARTLVESLRIHAVLDGARGTAPADIDGLVAALVALGELAAAAGPRLAELEINPLVAHAHGVVAVDVLATT